MLSGTGSWPLLVISPRGSSHANGVGRPLPGAGPGGRALSGEGRDSRRAPDRQGKAMVMNPDLATQLTREHRRQMLAQASQQ